MSVRGQPASSPPVQAQPRHIGPPQTRGQTPPLHYRPELYQTQDFTQQPHYNIPVASQSYDVNKQGFAAPNIPNQGVATPQSNMYSQQGMRQGNQPPFYSNRTQNIRQNYPGVAQQPPQNQNMTFSPQMGYMIQQQYAGNSPQIFVPMGHSSMLPRMTSNLYHSGVNQSQAGSMYPLQQQGTVSYAPNYGGNQAGPVYYNPGQRPPSAPGQGSAPQTKEKKKSIIQISDPTTGKNITEDILHSSGQAAGSTSDSGSRSTPVSNAPSEMPASSHNNDIAAEFASKVYAAARQPQQPQPPQQQQQQPPSQSPPANPAGPQDPQPQAIHHQHPTPLLQQQQQPPVMSSQINANVSMMPVSGDAMVTPMQQNIGQAPPVPVPQVTPNAVPSMDMNPLKGAPVVMDSVPVMHAQPPVNMKAVPKNDAGDEVDSIPAQIPSPDQASVPAQSLSNKVAIASQDQHALKGPQSVSDSTDSKPENVDAQPTSVEKESSVDKDASPPPQTVIEPDREKSPEVVASQKSSEHMTVSVNNVVPDKRTSEPSQSSDVTVEKPVVSEAVASVRGQTPEVNIVPPSPAEKEPSYDQPSKPRAPEAEPSQEVSVKDPPKKEKLNKKDLNKKGDSLLGTDMDAFVDSLPDDIKPDSIPSETVTETETSDSSANQTPDREVSPASVKEMSPADEKVQRVEIKVQDANVNPENTKNESEEEDEEDIKNMLKYKYSEDQWSPLNPEGKKHYDREFLLQFQFASEAIVKPIGLPEIPDIILDKPHQSGNVGGYRREMSDGGGRRGGEEFDFTPKYVWVQPGGGGRGGQNQIPRRMSGQKRMDKGPGGGPPPRQISLSLQKDVELHHAEKAWKPSHKESKDQSDEDVKTQELYKKARSILNKLTPQKFQTLISQMQALEIDSESKLKGVIDLVFEKAISEPNFSVAYANMCRCLSMFKVQSENKQGEMVNFRAVLLTRCQREFEKDKSSEQLFTTKRKEIADEKNETKKEELKAELEFEESKAKRRSLGNIRFIGELFKLKMLTETIMHDCVFKLLRTKDPENLECLCRLLTTIGKELDTDKARPRMDQYFQQMAKIVHEKKTSSRVRFMLQDVMDLRKNKWVPRRDDSNPKTIDQIHREVAKEAQEKALMSQQILVQQKTSKGSGGPPGGRRGPGSQGGPMGQGADGWNTVGTRTPLRSVDRTIDPAKMMKISKPQQVDDSIQLGPGGGAGRFAGWGRGSTGGGAKTSQESDRPSNPNRFSALGAKGDDESGRRGFSGASPAREGRGRGSFGRPTMLSARHSQESEREKAIAAAKSIGVSQSVESNRRERSRGREPQKERPIEKPAPEVKLLSSDEISKKTIAILDEYLHIQDIKEAVLCVKELPPGNHPDLVTNALNHVLERSAVARKQTGHLLHDVVKQGIVSVDSYLKGIKEVLEFAEDMEIDIPKIWQYLGELIGPMVQDGSVPLSFMKEACEPLKEGNKAGVLVAEVLYDASHREGHKKVAELWSSSGLQWSDFVPKNQVEQFLKDKELEFTKGGDSAPTTPTTGLPLAKISEQLVTLIVHQKANNEQVFDWIESNVDEPTTKQKKFIRALMTAVCSSAITGEGSSAKVDPREIKNRNDLLQKYLDHQAESELQALYALQALVTKLEHPPGVLRQMFDTLYDEDIISEDAFIQWEKSDDAQEQEGKGVAMKQVVQFFTWLKEADDDADS